ncbi:AAA family ATPase [Epidermidibacterium keratini]|uniref:AAA family ATPase n=1 Tax=Epidermidibacterium keratini TaxID=1891644 RepID=A0A7L4YN68_9ACTN|nr:helix-turn-helix transcriptional regulator [Epidermidibacterium keratini]QHC00333.1 AAA family ATPase [Epidermidibacterium keratini]
MSGVPRWGSDTPLVGRREELAALTDAVARADGGRPSGILLAGEAGVGKSRLLHALDQHAAEGGALMLTGYCVDLGHGLPYLPFRDAIGALATDGEYAELIARIPAIAPLVSTELAAEEVDSSAVYGGVLRLLDVLSADRTVVLVLEDLHWADESSRNLLHFLLSRLRRQRLVVIGSYRLDDVYRTHPLRRLLAELVRLPDVERLDLPRLSDPELRTLLKALEHDGAAPPRGVLDKIVHQADGNAFYAEELFAARIDDADPASVPTGLSDLLLTRIERLNQAAQRVVRSASVAGRSVPYSLLRATLTLSDDDLDDALRDVASHHVMHSDDGEVYTFRHALLQEAAYADLLPGERVRLHAAYAELLAAADPSPRTAADRAHHLYESNNLAASLRASLEAAEFARRSGAPAQRLTHLENVLELWGSLPAADVPEGVTEGEVLRRAGAAAFQAGQLPRAVSLGEAAIEASTDDAAKVRAQVELAKTLMALDRDGEAHTLTAAALTLAPPDSESRLWALATHARAVVLTLRVGDDGLMDYTEADQTIGEALELARRLGRSDVEADVIVTMMSATQDDRQSDDGAAQLEHALELARSAGRVDVEQRVVFNLAIGRYEAGRLDAALHWSEVGRALALRSGAESSPYALSVRGIEILSLYHRGRWDEALQRVAEAPKGIADDARMAGSYVAIARGERDVADWIASRLPADGRTGGHFMGWLHGGSAMIEHSAWRGDAEAAYDWYTRTAAASMTDFHREPGARLAALALWAIADDGADRWRAIADDLVQVARSALDYNLDRWRVDGPESLAWMAMAEAEYSRIAGGDEIALFEAAYDAFGYGDRYRQAIIAWRLAELYAAAGRKDEAAERLRAAHEFAASVGAAPLLDKLRDLDARARLHAIAEQPASGGAANPLTERELDVLRLVDEGKTNKQIAATLFISAKTASVHVSNILAKTGAGSRTEAAAIARRSGWL